MPSGGNPADSRVQPAADRREGERAAPALAAAPPGLPLGLDALLALPGARIASAFVTAALLTISFPDFDLGAAAWIALVPLAAACEGTGLPAAFGLGLLAGTATAFDSCDWIFNVPHFGAASAAALALYLGLYPAAWCAGLVSMRRARAPMVVAGAALWVALDFIRAHAGFLAVSWTTLAQSQHADLALLQTASLTGEAGVTFAVVAVNLAIVVGLTRRRWRPLGAAAVAVALLHLGGAFAIARARSTPSIQVAVVQPAITQREALTDRGWNDALGRLERLTREAEASSPKPALVVWPETAVRNLGGSPALAKQLKTLARSAGVPIILGSSDPETSLTWNDSGISIDRRYRNAAWMIPAHGPIPAAYYKMILLPFAEYRPLARWVRWPEWLAPRMFDTMRGHTRTLFQLSDGTRVAPIICWENLFAGRVRRSVAGGARLIVHLVNDNWFGPSAEPRQHELASVIRAVENRVPVVVASNTGPSEIIAPTGRVVAQGPGLFVSGFISARVTQGAGSPYTWYGDLFAWLCVAAAALAIGSALKSALSRGRNGHSLRRKARFRRVREARISGLRKIRVNARG
jgi:apolipoprotein N-acyltransferase